MATPARKRIRTSTGKPATWPAAWRGTVPADTYSEAWENPRPQPAASAASPPDEPAPVAAATTAQTPEPYGPPAPVCWCCGGGMVTREHPAVVCGFNQRPAYTETVVDLLPTCLPGLLICTECEGQMQRQTDAQAEQMMRRGWNDRFPRVKVINRWKPAPKTDEENAADEAELDKHLADCGPGFVYRPRQRRLRR